jgi:hypothetical protein
MASTTSAVESGSEAAPEFVPASGWELFAVASLVVLGDLTIYRGYGYSGAAALFAVAPLLLLLGARQRRRRIDFGVVLLMLMVLAASLVWCGGPGECVAGAVLLVTFAMILAGMRPYVVDIPMHTVITVVSGAGALANYLRSAGRVSPPIPRATWLKYVLPAVAVLGFGTIFLLANPDEARRVGEWIEFVWNAITDAIADFFPSFGELWFWVAAAWIAGGLLRPLVCYSMFSEPESATAPAEPDSPTTAEAPLFAAYRNTLIAVIGLFAIYLVFEFQTLWFRVFPKGFHYSGYAHEGAFWLTVALALATAVLSGIFRTSVLHDPRLSLLKRLAWVWSVLNLLLAAAVYNRMAIYMNFNGMTRMRTVGLLGISAVVVGFVLVVWKIVHGRNFVWLVNRQLWTLVIAIYLYAVLPVDWLVHTYNVRRILAGDPAPSVQITEHPIDSGGILALDPLLRCDDETIREGIRALLADRALRAEETSRKRAAENWTSFQLADRLLLDRLRRIRPDWAPYAESSQREAAWNRFREYAYQWY